MVTYYHEAVQNRLNLLNKTLENCLTAGMARGLYYQAYFDLLERVGEEVIEKLERGGLQASEILYIADRVEAYLKEKVFKTS